MNKLCFSRYALSICAFPAMLEGCGRSQPPIGASGALGAHGKKQSQTFNFTDSEQTFTVPKGVTAVTVTASGASGSLAFGSGPSALGGLVKATIPVTPGENLAGLLLAARAFQRATATTVELPAAAAEAAAAAAAAVVAAGPRTCVKVATVLRAASLLQALGGWLKPAAVMQPKVAQAVGCTARRAQMARTKALAAMESSAAKAVRAVV